MVRVVFTGSESTGKTTLAYQLAGPLDAIIVPEYVRDYAARKGAPIEFSDHGAIARGQIELEDAHIARAAAEGKALVIQDTDLLSTVVYCEHYFGRCPDWIRAAAAERRPDLYLLMEIDVPWIADEVRDRGGERRDEMQQLFREAVKNSGVEYDVIAGSWAQRYERAMSAIAAVMR
jgi:NadR type nicotinamide-nucleotide adenylyltransferase